MTRRKYSGIVLDFILAIGHFRMQQEIFTTKVLCTNLDCYDVFWLRTLIDSNLAIEKHPIYKQNERFKITIREAEISDEVEKLYLKYKNHVLFDAPESVRDYLFGEYTENEFESYLVEVRDHDLLIGVGYFDKGNHAIAGIMNFYHPEYKRFSIGKYLMLLKMQFAQNKGIKYYYTGYISTTYNKFDYKLFPDKTNIEVLVNEEIGWQPFTTFDKNRLRAFGILNNNEEN